MNAVVLTANVARIYAQGTRLDPCTKSQSERSRYGAVALYKHFEHLSSLLITAVEHTPHGLLVTIPSYISMMFQGRTFFDDAFLAGKTTLSFMGADAYS